MNAGFRAAILAALSLTIGSTSVAQDGAVLIHDQAGAFLELEGESRLEIVGLTGTYVVRAGADRELRYEVRARDDRRADQPVALWLDGGTLRIAPLGDAAVAVILEVAVPPQLDLVVKTSDSHVTASALEGNLTLSGENLDLVARGIKGALDIDVAGGKIGIDGIDEPASVTGADLEVTLRHARAPVYIDLEASDVELVRFHDEVEGQLDGGTLTAMEGEGLLRLEVNEGRVDLRACAGGGELRLTDTPLVLTRTKGILDVETNASVDFEDHEGGLRILAYGAPVTGVKLDGMAEIETSDVAVRLEQLTGTSKIRGNGLDLQVTNVRGDLDVETTSSKIVIQQCHAVLKVRNDFGQIEIHDVSQAVEVSGRDTEIRITELQSSLQLVTEAPRVEVAWSKFNSAASSLVQNDTGDVTVRLPASLSCRVEAEAPYGRVESDLDGMTVSDDEHFGSGLLGHAARTPHVKKPTIQLRAGGDLYVAETRAGE